MTTEPGPPVNREKHAATEARRSVSKNFNMKMRIGDKVRLKTFNGRLKPDDNCPSSENYWKLIGSTGEIVNDPTEKNQSDSFSENQRLLVQFKIDVESLGLECHNNIENSLWILESDLAKL